VFHLRGIFCAASVRLNSKLQKSINYIFINYYIDFVIFEKIRKNIKLNKVTRCKIKTLNNNYKLYRIFINLGIFGKI